VVKILALVTCVLLAPLFGWLLLPMLMVVVPLVVVALVIYGAILLIKRLSSALGHMTIRPGTYTRGAGAV